MNRYFRFSSCATACLVMLAGCSSVNDFLAGDKVDYHTANQGGKSNGLEVPPDLSQLTRESRYQPTPTGAVSAASFQAPASAAAASAQASAPVAAQSMANMHIERLGNERWLQTKLTPEQLWPQLLAFWKDMGFVVTQDSPTAGVMETDWAENRGKLPQDFIRSSIGKVFDSAYSTGELDKFRTRVERGPDGGTEVYITHRGMIEVYTGQRRDTTSWQPRQADPQLEGEMLSRLMLKLSAPNESVAKAEVPKTPAVEAASAAAPQARLVTGQPAATLQVDDGFDRAWRRVGVALDRSGFTVEDRDRTQGLYFVRYVDPKFAGKEEPGFFSRLFGSDKKKKESELARYRVLVKGEGDKSLVTVQNNQGEPENGEAGQRIVRLLLDDLK